MFRSTPTISSMRYLFNVLLYSLLFITPISASPFLISDPYPAMCCDRSNLPSECNQSYPTTCPLPNQCNIPENCIKDKPCGQPTSFSIKIDNGTEIDTPFTLNSDNEPYLKYDLSSLTNANHTIEVSAKSNLAKSCPTSISFRKGKPAKATGFYIQ